MAAEQPIDEKAVIGRSAGFSFTGNKDISNSMILTRNSMVLACLEAVLKMPHCHQND